MSNVSFKHHGILGMKWGIRRYQNPDGTLTEAGKRRYSYDVSKNAQKSKKNRVDDEDLMDPDRWVKEDLESTRSAISSSREMVNTTKSLVDTFPKKEKERLDLSDMSDSELRNLINREMLERQYNQMFNAPEVSKGRVWASKTLDTTGKVLAIGSTALTIALAMRELKRGNSSSK